MDVEEKVLTVLEGGVPDRIPMLIYSNHLPRGSFEREMRNLGLGLDVRCSVYRAYTPNVKVERRTVGDYEYSVYVTPVGKVYSKSRVNLTFQSSGGSWLVEPLVKAEEDFEVLRFIIEDTVYEPDYESYLQVRDWLGGDGVVTVVADYTPLMKAIIRFLGFRTFAVMWRRNREAIEDLIRVIDEKYTEMYRVIADSPARIVRIGDNIDSMLISPRLFEKYCLPYYNKYAGILKKHDKFVISHMDGRLRILKDLIAKTRLDAVEAFTPPPMGDLPVREAREAWRDKVIWMNFPEEVFLRSADEVREYTLNLLREMSPGIGYIMSITEDIHPDYLRDGLGTLVRVLHDFGELPLKESNLRC